MAKEKNEVKELFEIVSSEVNEEKLATNETCYEDITALLEGIDIYKYFGLIEDNRRNQHIVYLKKYNGDN